jgi:hypothetical protein
VASFLLILAGTALIGLMSVDVLRTTLTLRGGGPVTRRTSALIWSLFKRWRGARRQHERLAHAGMIVILVTVAVWLALLWLGWTLIFMADSGAVLESMSNRPADWSGRAYFAGFTVITLGIGDYVPGGAGWRLLTVVASMSGFFLITLVITYLLPVLNAAVQKRSVAAYVTALGHTPDEMLEKAWNGKDFCALEQHLTTLIPSIGQIAHSYVAYPVLHYFHPPRRAVAFPPSLAVLDETLTLLTTAVPAEQRPSPLLMAAARGSIEELLYTLDRTASLPQAEAPPLHSRFIERQAWRIPTQLTEEDRRRRCLFFGWILHDGWRWQDVHGRG